MSDSNESHKSKTTALSVTDDERCDVLRDLFARLPTRDLAYGCRGASLEWQALLDEPALRRRVEKRLDVVESLLRESQPVSTATACAATPSTATPSNATASTQDVEHKGLLHNPYDRFLQICKPVFLRWHREYILRRFREAHVDEGGALEQLWTDRCSGAMTVDRETAPPSVCASMQQRTADAREALTQRVMVDRRDRLVEQQTLALEWQASLAAPFDES